MKIKGGELALFIAEAWPGDDWYWDHEEFDGDPDPEAAYDTADLGGIYFQGRGEDPTHGSGYSLSALIKKWRTARTYDVMTIIVPKGQREAAVAAIQALGGKVSS